VEGEVEAAEAEAPAASDTPGEEATQEAAVADEGPTLEDVDTPSYSPAKVQRANRRTPKKDKEEEPAPANEDEIEAVESAEAEAPEPEPSNGKRASKKRPKRSRAPQANVSPEEQKIRGFQALHTLLNNEIWAPIAVDSQAKPSSIFAPRQHFDKQWATPEFRESPYCRVRIHPHTG
tara:strand:- start:1909 stop:2439 length:531 start_codon:yes stop_codon:yes gene_type:complete